MTLNDPAKLQEQTFKFNSTSAVTDMAVVLYLTADDADPQLWASGCSVEPTGLACCAEPWRERHPAALDVGFRT